MMQGCLHMKVSTLRRLAYASMIIDHAAVVLIYPMYLAACMVGHIVMMGDLRPQKAIDLSMLYNIGRCIGRIAFPSFACMLVGGFLRSRDLKRYHLRLLFLQSGAGWGGLWSIWLDIPFLFFINLRYSEGGRVRRRYYLIYPIHFLLLFVLKQLFVHLPI